MHAFQWWWCSTFHRGMLRALFAITHVISLPSAQHNSSVFVFTSLNVVPVYCTLPMTLHNLTGIRSSIKLYTAATLSRGYFNFGDSLRDLKVFHVDRSETQYDGTASVLTLQIFGKFVKRSKECLIYHCNEIITAVVHGLCLFTWKTSFEFKFLQYENINFHTSLMSVSKCI